MPQKRLAPPPLWALAPIAVAAGLVLARWLLQGTGNLYTQADKRFYAPDPDLGWRLESSGRPWLGLDALAVVVGLAVAIALGALVLRRMERRRGERVGARRALFLIAAAPLLVPLWAFAGGGAPEGAEEQPPGHVAAAPTEGVTGKLAGLPPGTYRVLEHEGSMISAELRAGGERFPARFAGGLRGHARLDPGDLTQPMSAVVEVATSSIRTGIDLRDEHARRDLKVEEHPLLRFELRRLLAARQDPAGAVAFHAAGEVDVMGKRQPVDVTGTLRAVDAPGRARLGLQGPGAAMTIQASFAILLDRTPIGDNGGTFTENRVPVTATLVLQQPGGDAGQPNDGE